MNKNELGQNFAGQNPLSGLDTPFYRRILDEQEAGIPIEDESGIVRKLKQLASVIGRGAPVLALPFIAACGSEPALAEGESFRPIPPIATPTNPTERFQVTMPEKVEELQKEQPVEFNPLARMTQEELRDIVNSSKRLYRHDRTIAPMTPELIVPNTDDARVVLRAVLFRRPYVESIQLTDERGSFQHNFYVAEALIETGGQIYPIRLILQQPGKPIGIEDFSNGIEPVNQNAYVILMEDLAQMIPEKAQHRFTISAAIPQTRIDANLVVSDSSYRARVAAVNGYGGESLVTAKRFLEGEAGVNARQSGEIPLLGPVSMIGLNL